MCLIHLFKKKKKIIEFPMNFVNIIYMSVFNAGWESLLLFVKNSILNGSKEVALAAINCLQTTVVSHSAKVISMYCLS